VKVISSSYSLTDTMKSTEAGCSKIPMEKEVNLWT